MEEPRVGRLNSTNNQPAESELPSYNDVLLEAGPSGIGNHLVAGGAVDAADNLSDMESDGLIFTGPDAEAVPDPADASINDPDDISECR